MVTSNDFCSMYLGMNVMDHSRFPSKADFWRLTGRESGDVTGSILPTLERKAAGEETQERKTQSRGRKDVREEESVEQNPPRAFEKDYKRIPPSHWGPPVQASHARTNSYQLTAIAPSGPLILHTSEPTLHRRCLTLHIGPLQRIDNSSPSIPSLVYPLLGWAG
ncbi:hypothetical protein R1sor_000137 [Riccia sorocarpa]|uniref:Uncharacterized protein n=1 Tax=Riccia sorocarpa TaxID=122646 RepID=A0ABD3GVF2_9MARC